MIRRAGTPIYATRFPSCANRPSRRAEGRAINRWFRRNILSAGAGITGSMAVLSVAKAETLSQPSAGPDRAARILARATQFGMPKIPTSSIRRKPTMAPCPTSVFFPSLMPTRARPMPAGLVRLPSVSLELQRLWPGWICGSIGALCGNCTGTNRAEWSIMLYGSAGITAVDDQGRNFVDDVHEGDLWYFPSGIPHSIRGIGDDGCEFLLVFDDGSFNGDSSLPRHRLVQACTAFCSRHEFRCARPKLWPYTGPGAALHLPLAGSRPSGFGPRLRQHTDTAKDEIRQSPGCSSSNNFKAPKRIAAALVEIEPGGMRELHWHPKADEWQYYIAGQARMGVFGASEDARTFDYRARDVPFAMGHYVVNSGNETLRFLEMFRSPVFADVSLNQWMALTPPELVQGHLKLDDAVLQALEKKKSPIVPG